MNKDSEDLDFLQELAKKISKRSKQASPISIEEVFDLFSDTLNNMTHFRSIEVPIFVPFIIEKEDGIFTARCRSYCNCRGMGYTEEEAIEKLKKDIDLYNKSLIETEKRMRLENIVNRTFGKDFL
ncbi:hypothetical protein GMB86_07165 [Terrilactibacillus sp. BCM23-1]|uniref:Uncharacterized protein n=1 Tax=Terrilactibacillus tamarindi TaxID=2599694 RepID=A0A6N8CP71_9BACI|nr:type II toxin-antitoxin system HicB family antitoxin [Terrilactibacillus tamarindi]MTT31791.1 hypothetical protein [Terrilactibacillus tamarindi]